jgi:hypothetical protein
MRARERGSALGGEPSWRECPTASQVGGSDLLMALSWIWHAVTQTTRTSTRAELVSKSDFAARPTPRAPHLAERRAGRDRPAPSEPSLAACGLGARRAGPLEASSPRRAALEARASMADDRAPAPAPPSGRPAGAWLDLGSCLALQRGPQEERAAAAPDDAGRPSTALSQHPFGGCSNLWLSPLLLLFSTSSHTSCKRVTGKEDTPRRRWANALEICSDNQSQQSLTGPVMEAAQLTEGEVPAGEPGEVVGVGARAARAAHAAARRRRRRTRPLSQSRRARWRRRQRQGGARREASDARRGRAGYRPRAGRRRRSTPPPSSPPRPGRPFRGCRRGAARRRRRRWREARRRPRPRSGP